jgi:membrane fusion protein (multidrug efflux system)
MKTHISLFSLFIILAACGTETPTETPVSQTPVAETSAKDLAKVVTVKAERIQPKEFVNNYTVIGNVKANRDVTLSSEAAGRIIKFYKKLGDRVQAGDAICKIDDALLVAEKNRLSAVLKQSKENYDRLERLWRDEKVGSEMEYLNAKYAYEQAKAGFASITEQLDRTTLKAPFDGFLDIIISDLGTTVAPGSPMVRLIQDNLMKVTGGVPARFAGVVSTGQPVKIDVRNGQVLSYQRKLDFVSATIDPKARTFRIEVFLPNDEHHLKVDAEASITIETERIKNAIVIGQEFIGRNESGYIVFVVEQQDGEFYARARNVEIGASGNNQTVIVSGLKTGDVIVTEGFNYVEDRSRIRLSNPTVAASL